MVERENFSKRKSNKDQNQFLNPMWVEIELNFYSKSKDPSQVKRAIYFLKEQNHKNFSHHQNIYFYFNFLTG